MRDLILQLSKSSIYSTKPQRSKKHPSLSQRLATGAQRKGILFQAVR
nr:hypothetical protein [Salmonella enterica]